MKRLLCQSLPSQGRPAFLNDVEAHHAMQVLRLRDGEKVEALDGSGKSVTAILRVSGKTRLELDQTAKPRTDSDTGAVLPIDLEISIIKGDAMEWAIEKAVELGVETLTPVISDRTVVQVDKKGPAAFQERWQKIADQALKQCGRLKRLEIQLPVELEELEARNPAAEDTPRIWCDEVMDPPAPQLLKFLSERPTVRRVRILIGPEGGFSERERDYFLSAGGFARVSLGPLVMRAETAAIFSSSIVSAYFRAR